MCIYFSFNPNLNCTFSGFYSDVLMREKKKRIERNNNNDREV